MPEPEEHYSPQEYKKIAVITVLAVFVLCTVTIGSYVFARQRTGTTVLPGGVTYLGPSPTPFVSLPSSTIEIPANTLWGPYQGKIFPYTFIYPTNLSLGVFPNDPFDGVTIFWKDTNPQENIFLRVEDLNKIKEMSAYINKPKKEYANIWWKQYNWKGVASVDPFTNSKGMKGYRAKFINDKGQTPFDNIFFEIPGKPNLVVWLASRLLDTATFDKIADSFNWNQTGASQL
jgi:hypothetical protein